MNNLSIKIKLIALTVLSLILLSISILSISTYKTTQNAENDKLEQLNAMTAAKKQHISQYFEDIGNLLVSTANTASTADALYYFSRFFAQIENENKNEINIDEIKQKLTEHYEKNYLNQINFDIKNIQAKKETKEYLPQDNDALIAQYIYIVENSAKIGEKNDMAESTSLKNTYTINHEKFHPTFNTILKKFELYDIFLVDEKGTVVYSAFKEKDFATNLVTGPYSNSGLAKAYNEANKLKAGEIAFADFAPYEPSYNTPASFIATPIFKKDKRMGTLIIQFPINVIDKIMNFEGKYKESGLGETGISYLVGDDFKMRNNSRFLETITDEKVKIAKTTISTYEIKTSSVQNALNNQSGSTEINFENKDLLSSYASIKIFDKNWAIISEIEKSEALESIVHLNILLFVVVLIILSLIIIFSVIILNKLILNPIKDFEMGLLNFFKYLNNESTQVIYLNEDKNDEIGNMSKIVNKNIETVKNNLEKDRNLLNETVQVLSEFEKGDLFQRIKTNTSNPALNELKNVLNNMGKHLEENISNILNILEQYTKYNYLNRVENKDLKEHLLKLSNGVNSLGESITKMLVDNKTNGIKINIGSNVLLKSVDNLNINANEAKESLERTSIALVEITNNIQENNKNVQEMSNFAEKLNNSVKIGESLANKTTQAMDEINQQVSSINEAIEVIDQIAFQTNILSLNAAVEAATAGEAGKGFAVVAQEVRNLANRSADAAREIKNLVENANKKADEGKKITDDMIKGYLELNTNINSTITLINNVSISSNEQKRGIEQVNSALLLLENKTQENAFIAQNTYNITSQTSLISKQIVDDSEQKEFLGKNEIKESNFMDLFSSKSSVKESFVSKPKSTINTRNIQKEVISSNIKNSSKHEDKDEWESF